MNNLKFSGHDTFHCRQQWLLKGLKLIDSEGFTVLNQPDVAISKLGVGKNMVQSIQHWLKAFGLLDDNHDVLDFTKKMFLGVQPYDSYLEDEGTLWLLQYKICNTKYASIFHLIFAEYFKDKVSLEFSESQILNFIEKKIRENNDRDVSRNTLSSDFKAFVRSYALPKKSLKTIEDDFNSPLLELNLISQSNTDKFNNETVYKINKEIRNSIPVAIFAYCLLDYLEDRVIISHDEVRNVFGSYFCLSNDGLDNLIDNLCSTFPEFIYSSTAGNRNIQFEKEKIQYKNNLLESYYGI